MNQAQVLSLAGSLPKEYFVLRSGAAGIFPFRFGGKPVAVGGEIARQGLGVVAGLQALLERTQVAVKDGVIPIHLFDRLVGGLGLGRVLLHQGFVGLLRDLVRVHVEGADLDFVRGLFVGVAVVVAHDELAGREEDHAEAGGGGDGLALRGGGFVGWARLARLVAAGEEQSCQGEDLNCGKERQVRGAEGGRVELRNWPRTSNIQHPTSNIQWVRVRRSLQVGRRGLWTVDCGLWTSVPRRFIAGRVAEHLLGAAADFAGDRRQPAGRRP